MGDGSVHGDVSRFEFDRQTLVVEQFAAVPDAANAPLVSSPVTTFVLVHGLGLGRGAYIEVAQELRQYGDVVTLDLPGFGEAPEPPRTPSMQRLGDLVAALVRAYGLRHVTLVGHSMGTQIAAWAVVRHPGVADAVVLVAPTVDESARTVLKQAWRLVTGLGDMNPKTVLRGAREYLRAGPHVIRKTKATVYDHPERAYRQIDVPVLVVRGALDRVVTAPWADQVRDMVPHALFEEVPGRGHGTILRGTLDIARSIAAFARDARDGVLLPADAEPADGEPADATSDDAAAGEPHPRVRD